MSAISVPFFFTNKLPQSTNVSEYSPSGAKAPRLGHPIRATKPSLTSYCGLQANRIKENSHEC